MLLILYLGSIEFRIFSDNFIGYSSDYHLRLQERPQIFPIPPPAKRFLFYSHCVVLTLGWKNVWKE